GGRCRHRVAHDRGRTARPDPPRLDAPRHLGRRFHPPPARAGEHPRRPRDHAHRARPGGRQAAGLRIGRRRLRDQALLAARPARPRARDAAPGGARGVRGSGRGRGPADRAGDPPRVRRRGRARAQPDGVPAAALLHAQSRPRAVARPAARQGLGRRRLHRGAHRGRAHPPAAAGASPDRARPPRRDGARRRLPARARMMNAIAFGIPLLALLVGAALFRAGMELAAALWLGAWLALLAIYHGYFMGRLNHWAGLPKMRDVPIGFGAWRRPMDRLARFMRTEAEEQRELSDELEQLRAAVDRLPDGLMLLDRFNHVEWANVTARDLHGVFGNRRPVHHFLNQPEFVDYLDAGHFSRPLRLGLPNRPGRTFEIRVHSSDDAKKLLIVRDITDQARLDAMRSDFVANVSHEIRTPITVIGGFAETMLELELEPEERRQYLESISKHSQTMQRLVEDLLTLSSLESAIDRPADEPIEIDKLCASLISEARV